jgi:hypothetical protein
MGAEMFLDKGSGGFGISGGEAFDDVTCGLIFFAAVLQGIDPVSGARGLGLAPGLRDFNDESISEGACGKGSSVFGGAAGIVLGPGVDDRGEC